MITNGIRHDFKKGQLVQNINFVGEEVWKIVNFTDKRVVVKEVGVLTVDGIQMNGKNLSKKSMTPENLIAIEKHIKVIH